MSAFHRGARTLIRDIETLAIVLTASLLEWLRELPARRALHMLKLIEQMHRKYDERAWSARLKEMAGKLRLAHDSGSPEGVVAAMQQILSCFGGPGSLDGIYLSAENGHTIKAREVEAVNAHLGALRTQLYLSARQAIARVEWQRRARVA